MNGYVITLQKLDKLLNAAVKRGDVVIEEADIAGIDTMRFDI